MRPRDVFLVVVRLIYYKNDSQRVPHETDEYTLLRRQFFNVHAVTTAGPDKIKHIHYAGWGSWTGQPTETNEAISNLTLLYGYNERGNTQ